MSKLLFNEIFDEGSHEFAKIKGTQRVQINNILSAIAVTIIALLISNGKSDAKISDWILIQLSASIPLLITSSLFYTKICYRNKREYPYWNTAAGLTHSLGYFFIINAIALIMYFGGYKNSAWVLIISIVFLILVYSSMDYLLNRKRLLEKIIKFIIYITIITLGVIPMLR